MGGPPRVRGDPLGSRRSERESSMLFFHMHGVFFFEIPPFEELLHSKCSTHREELGRPTPRVPRVFSTIFFLD